MTSGLRAKYGYLLEDPAVGRWYRNVARGSRITADVYLRGLGRFCIDYSLTPRRLVELGERGATDFLLEVVDKLSAREMMVFPNAVGSTTSVFLWAALSAMVCWYALASTLFGQIKGSSTHCFTRRVCRGIPYFLSKAR